MIRFIACVTVFSLSLGAARAGPGELGSVAGGERPYTLQEAEARKQAATFGLCSLPQNADDLPTRPVAVQEGRCEFYQHFESTSAQPSNGSPCGGYTVAFGPMGDLKTTWHRYQLKASYGEALTQAQCPKARLSAVAWGARCLNADCSNTQWEKIGVPLSKQGVWSANQGRCYLEHQFLNNQNHYKTLNIDTIALLQEGTQAVRKRAHALIHAEIGNGQCFSVTQEPHQEAPARPEFSASHAVHTKP
jgi:hypothetical protein